MWKSRPGYEGPTVTHVALILVAIWVGFAFYSLLAHISGLLTVRDYEPDVLGDLAFGTVKIWLPWVVISPLVVFLANRVPVRPDNWVRQVFIHMLLLVALSLLIGAALGFHYYFREEMSDVMQTYLPWQHIGHFLFGDSFFLYNAIIYTVFIASFNIRAFYQLAQSRKLDSVLLQSQLNEARLRALKMQVNPHFLFNTLNAINVLVMKGDTGKASEMVNRLADFFRTTLEESDDQWVPLSRELDNTEKYLAIEQVRFGDRLKISTRYDDAALPMLVPAMILQPLVENAIQHGVAEREGACDICLEAQIKGDRLQISIRDNGVGCGFDLDPEYSEGVGIRNVRQRLAQSFDNDFVLGLTGETARGTVVSIDVPARKKATRR